LLRMMGLKGRGYPTTPTLSSDRPVRPETYREEGAQSPDAPGSVAAVAMTTMAATAAHLRVASCPKLPREHHPSTVRVVPNPPTQIHYIINGGCGKWKEMRQGGGCVCV